MRIIDIETWNRRKQYENFISYTNPVFSVGTTVDVTGLVELCRKNKISFFSAFLYVITKCSNKVPEMRLRIKGENVIQFDAVHPSYVVLCEGDELKTCVTYANDDFLMFYQNSRKDIANVRSRESQAYNEGVDNDVLYVSCIPWIRLNSISNPYNLLDKEQSSIPRITWGKYYLNGERYEIYLDIAAHHALVDGVHVAQLVQMIEEELTSIDFNLEGGVDNER